ncbi:MAG: hypothetical protein EBQ83_00580 [Burkholderiaceae bacterium]|nr:hypothetical protein [Burkholderiaceae bacterium]
MIEVHSSDDLETISKAFGLMRKRGALPTLGAPASFGLANQKRETLEAVLTYFEKQAKTPLPTEGEFCLPLHYSVALLLIKRPALCVCPV